MATAHQKKIGILRSSRGNARAELAGSAHIFLIGVMTALFVSGGCYLYSVNQNAVEGYHMRALEKEIMNLEQKNAELRIVEADLRSLHRIEEVSSRDLEMQKFENVTYRERSGPTAFLGGSVALR